jgi:hypothetical protein
MEMKVMALALLLVLPVSAQVVVQTLDAPDTNISGIAFGAGCMWAVDGVTNNLYKLDPATGSVLASWYIPNSTDHPTGLGFGSDQLFVGMGSDSVYIYTTGGAYVSQFSAIC